MGRPIVYCGICGKSLREEDFSKGRAHTADNSSFCVDCRIVPEPIAKPAPPPAAAKPTPAPKTLPSSTPRHHSASPPPPPESSSNMLIIGIVVAVFAILALILVLLNSGRPSIPMPEHTPAPKRGPETGHAPIPRTPEAEDPARTAIRNLEAFASSSSDPNAILDRCQETRPLLRGTPHLARLDEIEAKAVDARNVRNQERQVTLSLDGVKKMREFDSSFKQREEIERMLTATLPIAGSRKAEVEKILAEYRQAYASFSAKPPEPPPVPDPAPAPLPVPVVQFGPYGLDDGGMVHHWLVLGPFGSRKVRDAFMDHDLLKTEADYVPAAGKEVVTREGKAVRWTPTGPAPDRVLFRSMEHLGLASAPSEPAIVFVACWLDVEKDCQVKFRMLVDQGYLLWLDHRRIMKQTSQSWGMPEDTQPVSLTAGLHLVLLKVATVGDGDFGFRLRIADLAGARASGIRVWTQPPPMPRILFSENFNQGLGDFKGGEIVAGGADGTPALALPKKGTLLGRPLPEVVGSNWTLRFRLKPLCDMNAVEIVIWSNVSRANFRYHLRGLKKDQWYPMEVKASQLNQNWNGGGKTFEGETVNALRLYYDDAVPDGSLLLDDVQISD